MNRLSNIKNQSRQAALAATAFALLLLIAAMARIPQGTAGAQTPNNQASGKPAITGDAQAGGIMTAGTQAISDADGIPPAASHTSGSPAIRASTPRYRAPPRTSTSQTTATSAS